MGYLRFACFSTFIAILFCNDQKLQDAGALVPYMNTSLPTVLIIHGYFESVERFSTPPIVSAYLNRTGFNILGLDYRFISRSVYSVTVYYAKYIGEDLARALESMGKAGLNLKTLHLVGHSMGAQIAGYCGRNADFSIPRITGLDPAGPSFQSENPYLNAKDGVFVDIIHTDMGFYGNSHISGKADFLPNCGHRVQPGAQNIEAESHLRSWQFYAESVMNDTAFLSINCLNDDQFKAGTCNQSDTVYMGFAAPPTANGTYYLVTAPESPYGLGSNGLKPDPNNTCYMPLLKPNELYLV